MLKSIAVVVGSYLLSIALVLATDPTFLSRLFPGDFVRGRVPPTPPSLPAPGSSLSSRSCAPGCAPGLPPSHAARHVLWFFLLGEAMGIAATIPNWSKGWPHWSWLSWQLTSPVSCWLGLLLGGRRKHLTSAQAST